MFMEGLGVLGHETFEYHEVRLPSFEEWFHVERMD